MRPLEATQVALSGCGGSHRVHVDGRGGAGVLDAASHDGELFAGHAPQAVHELSQRPRLFGCFASCLHQERPASAGMQVGEAHGWIVRRCADRGTVAGPKTFRKGPRG
jgi:hypothetical protein